MSIEMGATVTLKEAADLIVTCGKDVSFMLQGPMGIGKSSLLQELASAPRAAAAPYCQCRRC